MNNFSHHKGCSQSICHNRHGLIKAKQSKRNRAECCTDVNVAGLLTRNCRVSDSVCRSLELRSMKQMRRIFPFRQNGPFFERYSKSTSQSPELGSQTEILYQPNNRLFPLRHSYSTAQLLAKRGRHQSHLLPRPLITASSHCLAAPDACL